MAMTISSNPLDRVIGEVVRHLVAVEALSGGREGGCRLIGTQDELETKRALVPVRAVLHVANSEPEWTARTKVAIQSPIVV